MRVSTFFSRIGLSFSFQDNFKRVLQLSRFPKLEFQSYQKVLDCNSQPLPLERQSS